MLLCPERVLIIGKDDVKLWSSNGLVTVVVPAGSVFSPITRITTMLGSLGCR